MTSVRVKGFKIFKDRHGKQRCYHRRSGLKIDLQIAPIGSPDFFAECARIAALENAQKSLEPKLGTLGGLIHEYFTEEHFQNLSDASKREYRMCADLLHPIQDTPVHVITTPLIARIHDKIAKKKSGDKANRVRTFLIQVFKFGIPKGLVEKNFAQDVIPKPRPKDLGYQNRPWKQAEVKTVLKHASPALRAALAMMLCTGLDPSDAISVTRDEIDGDTIYKNRNKTQSGAAVPIGSTLRDELNRAPSHSAETVLASSKGTPWTYDGLSSAWHRLKKKLEANGKINSGLTMKGLRHTMATSLREAGLSERDI
ncbi:MAG: tyrosine-type recombinase/integrase, partial [Hyphomicrobiales bacterium]